MKLVVMASGEFAIPTLRSIAARNVHQILHVITQPDRPAGRGRELTPTPVREIAAKLGLPCTPIENVNTPQALEIIRSPGAELGLVIAFGQKLGPTVLEAFPNGCVNLHASLLPKYRGAAPIQWAIVNGEEQSGVTVFRITDRMDAGAVLSQRRTIIKPSETADELHDRLAKIGPDAVQASLALWRDQANPPGTPQKEEDASKAPKLSKQHALLDFSQPAPRVSATICGLWSWPGTRAIFNSQRHNQKEVVTFSRARVAETFAPDCGTPGALGDSLYMATGTGWVEILELQPQGGRLMAWRDFVNGRHVQVGDFFIPAK